MVICALLVTNNAPKAELDHFPCQGDENAQKRANLS